MVGCRRSGADGPDHGSGLGDRARGGHRALAARIRLRGRGALTGRAQGEVRIVNISSIYGLMTTPLTGWYQASKHALEALSDALRVELAADGIAVVLIEPGAFRSNVWENAGSQARRPADSEYFAAYHRLDEGHQGERLMGDPIDVARLISSVMTAKRPKARYLVGYDARATDIHSKLLPTEVHDRLARLTLGP